MSLFQSSNRQALKPQAHAAGDRCPLCEQPIAQDIARRIETRQREQHHAALEQARAEATAAAEQRIAAVRSEAKVQAEAAALARLADIQAQLAQAKQAQTASDAQIAALKTAQEAGITLVAVARADGFEVFTHPHRIAGVSAPAEREDAVEHAA